MNTFKSIICTKTQNYLKQFDCEFIPSNGELTIERYHDVQVEGGRINFYHPEGSSGSGIVGKTLVKSIDIDLVGYVKIEREIS